MWYDAGMFTDDDNMRCEFESFKEIVEAKMETIEANNKAAHAENESASERLRTDFEKLRTETEKSVNSITIRMIGIVALGVAILAFILK